MRLAVVSDLHVGKASRAQDLTPHKDRQTRDRDYLATFCSFVRSSGLVADYLLVAGDITDSAHPEEFNLAWPTLLEISRSLKVSRKNILAVPGNHDVTWRPYSNYPTDSTGYVTSLRYSPLKYRKWPFGRMMRNGLGDLLSPPYLTAWDNPDLLVVGFNSSSHDKPSDSPHHGYMPKETFDALKALLKRLDMKSERPRVFLLHHHPVDHPTPMHLTAPDPSKVLNGPNLMELLADFKFDFVVHGHKHLPRIMSRSDNNGWRVNVLCAGSFSVNLDTFYFGSVQNQFHIIDFASRNTTDGRLWGTVRSWAYSAGAWMPSTEAAGLYHTWPFGSGRSVEEVIGSLKVALAGHPATRHLEWHDMVDASPDLGFLPPAAAQQVVGAIGEYLKLRPVGQPPDLVLIPPRP